MTDTDSSLRFQPLVCTRTGFVSGWEPRPAAGEAAAGAPSDPAAEARAAAQVVVVAARLGLVGPQTPLFLAATAAFRPVEREAGDDGGGAGGDAGFGRLLASVGLRPADVVLELPAAALAGHDALVGEAAEGWRRCGYRLGLAGLDAAGPAFEAVSRLRPSFVRLDPGLTTGIDRSSARFNLTEALLRHGRRTGARAIAVGVTRRGELDALLALGVELVQGPVLCDALHPPAPRETLAAARAVLAAHLRQADGRSSWAG
jgi:hypothetical protein